jgi:hypothetical protein
MIRIAIDVAHLPIAEMDPDAAATSAHVAGGCLDLDLRVGHGRCEWIVYR